MVSGVAANELRMLAWPRVVEARQLHGQSVPVSQCMGQKTRYTARSSSTLATCQASLGVKCSRWANTCVC